MTIKSKVGDYLIITQSLQRQLTYRNKLIHVCADHIQGNSSKLNDNIHVVLFTSHSGIAHSTKSALSQKQKKFSNKYFTIRNIT